MGVSRERRSTRYHKTPGADLHLMLAVWGNTEGGVNHANVRLRPHLILSQIGRQLFEIEGSVDFLVLYMSFNLAELLKENLAVVVKLFTGAHTLSLLRFKGGHRVRGLRRRGAVVCSLLFWWLRWGSNPHAQ